MDYDIVSEPKVKKGYLLTPPPSASKAKASNYNPALTSADKSRAKSTLLHSSFHIRSPSLSPYHSLCQPKRSDVKIFSQDLLHEYTFHVTKDWGLAFRFYDQNSNGVNGPTGFRAGRFQETNTRSNSPPDRRSKAFRDAAIIHLTPLSKPSGFISIFESPLPAIHRGLRSPANPHVAVIDLYQLAQAQKPRCPSLYPAASVIKQLKQRDKSEENSIPPYYSGRGEWIVWESIKRQAVLATFSVQDLRVYLRNHPTLEHVLRLTGIQRASNSREYNKFIINTQLPLSRASGHAIGHFLAWTGLDEKFLDAAALKIARGWKFFGCNHVQRQNQYLAGARIGRQEFLQDTRNPKARSSSSGSKKHEKHTCIAVDDDFDSKRRHIEAVLRLYNKSEECGNNVNRARDINIRLKRRYTPAVSTPSSISKEHEIHTYPAKDGEFVSRRRHINALLELG
ncbi:hypothetical protein MMC06_006862, partial [Schaereria dolodes]|nr:hypothetical protein [Schaereria dolodes]